MPAGRRGLDQVAGRFGMPGPSAIATLELAVRRLEEVAGRLKSEADRARQAVGALATANLDRFLRTQPQWRPVVEGGRAGSPPAVVGGMVASLAAFTGASDTGARLRGAREEAERLAALAYRTEVRLAAALRLRVLLTRLAGRAYLASRGTEAEGQRCEALQRCEQTALPAVPALPPAPAASERFPTWDEDEAGSQPAGTSARCDAGWWNGRRRKRPRPVARCAAERCWGRGRGGGSMAWVHSARRLA